MEITKTNKIEQHLKFELDNKDKIDFESVISKFIKSKTQHKIEGSIKRIYIRYYESVDIVEIEIDTIKEDKLKLLESIDVKEK